MRTVVAWLITLIWAAGYIRKLIDPRFPVPAEVTPVMLLAAGWLFGKDVKEKLRERVNKALSDPEGDNGGNSRSSRKPRAKDR